MCNDLFYYIFIAKNHTFLLLHLHYLKMKLDCFVVVLVVIDVIIVTTGFAVDLHGSMLVWYPFSTGRGYKITRG